MKKVFPIMSFLWFVCAVGCCAYYIWSDLIIVETHADALDNIMWAQASYESGSIFNVEYTYPYLIPFGGHLLMVPFIKIFGFGMLPVRLGMSIFTLALTITMLFFFKLFLDNWTEIFFYEGILLFFMNGTSKLREIFFAHVLHYSLAIVFFLLALCLLKYFYIFRKQKLKVTLITILLFLNAMIAGIDGPTVVLFSMVPFIGGIIWDFLFTEKKLKEIKFFEYIPLLGTVLGTGLGMIIYKLISVGHITKYGDEIMQYNLYSEWINNIFSIPTQWFSLFVKMFSYNEIYVDLFGKNGVLYTFKIILALVLCGVTIASFFVLKYFEEPLEKKLVVSHWIMTFVTIYFYMFGKISNVEWRMIPMWFTTIIVAILMLKHMRKSCLLSLQRIAMLGMFLLCANAMINGLLVINRNTDTSLWYGENTIIDILTENNLEYGYCTDACLSNSVSVLTEDKIKCREVYIYQEEVGYKNYQNNRNWYADQEGISVYFLICSKGQLERNPGLADEAIEIYEGSQYNWREQYVYDFVVLVYEENIISNKYSGVDMWSLEDFTY
ncbi:MAG: hypothetical protein IJZ00_03310 [Lachnospiraceae bacterium]|nr:hypothetical protein [Lachnospiraceae bacterium]